jgi:hypothetical protein
MPLIDLINAAASAELDATYALARRDGLKAAAIGEAERQRAAGLPVRELASDQGLGSLRLDAANLPATPVITKPDEVTAWCAEHAPQLVEASVRVPVAMLEHVLSLLEFADLSGPEVTARVDFRDQGETARWLADECIVQADPEIPRAWNVLHRDGHGHLTPVPGVTGVQPQPRWVLTANPTRKAQNKATAAEEIAGFVDELRARDAVERAPDVVERQVAAVMEDQHTVVHSFEGLTDPIGGRPRWKPDPAAPLPRLAGVDDAGAVHEETPEETAERRARIQAAATAQRDGYLALTRGELAALCRERGLPVSGNKLEQANRLVEADVA